MSPPRLIIIAGCLLAAASAFAAAPPEAPTPAIAEVQTADPSQAARRITAADARQALAKGEAVLVDVRNKEAYDYEHAQGAVTIPLGDIVARAGELPKDKLVITYCT